MRRILRHIALVLVSVMIAAPASFADRPTQRGSRHQGVNASRPASSNRKPEASRPSQPSARPSSGRPGLGSGNNNRPGNGSNNRPGNGNNNRPGNGNNNRPGNGSNNRPGNGSNNRPGNGSNNRPGNGNNRPGNGSNNRPGNGNNNRPGHRPVTPPRPGNNRPGHSGVRPPMLPPPHRPMRPVFGRPHYRPTPPPSWRPRRGLPVIGGILGLTFGTTLNVSLNYLYGNGFTVDGYTNDVVYLRNVGALNLIWTDAALYYGPSGLDVSSFYYSTAAYDLTRYDRCYSALTATYGVPVSTGNAGGTVSATWFGGNSGYITLTFGSGTGGRFLTTLTYGM